METRKRAHLDDQETYKSLSVPTFNLPSNLQLVYSPLTHSAHILTASDVTLLSHCSTFATLRAHAIECCDPAPCTQATPKQIEQRLTELASMGLLASHRWLTKYISEAFACGEKKPAPIATIGVPTRNRFASLERCLISYISNCKEYGKKNDFVVVDDSDTTEDRARTLAMLKSLKKRFGVAISYAGRQERTDFAALLVSRSKLPAEIIEYALLNPTGVRFSAGSCRNALLLNTIGDLVVSVDDDTVCRCARSPHFQQSLAFGSDWDPTEMWFYSDSDSVVRSMPSSNEDFLGTHERVLGKSLGLCLRGLGNTARLDISQADAGFLHNMSGDVPRVLATNGGIAGDSGLDGTENYWFLRRESFERLVQSIRAYRSALASRHVVRAPDQITICKETFVAGGNVGFDNRTFLPPFFPVKRLDDDMFGLCLRKSQPSCYVGWLPWTVLHLPPERRPLPADNWMDNISNLSVHDILPPVISSLPSTGGRGDTRNSLRLFGKQVEDLGQMPLTDFTELVRMQLFHAMSARMLLLNSRVKERGGRPGYWAKDVDRYLRLLRGAMVTDEFVVPKDLVRSKDHKGAVKAMQALVLRFGQMLQTWPEIVTAAAELRQRGTRLAQPQ